MPFDGFRFAHRPANLHSPFGTRRPRPRPGRRKSEVSAASLRPDWRSEPDWRSQVVINGCNGSAHLVASTVKFFMLLSTGRTRRLVKDYVSFLSMPDRHTARPEWERRYLRRDQSR